MSEAKMMMIQHLITINASYKDWSDFYSGSPTQTYISGATRITPSAGSVHVKHAIFKDLSPTQNGGAIYCSSVSLFLAEYTSFISCTPTGQGGAMYLIITGECVLSKVCGFCCLAINNYYLFDYIQVSQDITKKNQIIDSTICRTETESYDYIIIHNYGKQSLNSVNISHNKIRYCGIESRNQAISSDIPIKYCSFANNTAIYCKVIHLQQSAVQKSINYCNIINNEQKGSSLGVITTDGITKIENSCILGNKGSCIVYVSSGTGSSMSNCAIDFTSSSLISISITNTAKYSFINLVEWLSTAACKAKYGSYDLIVFPKKSRCICTYNCKQNKLNRYLALD